MAVATSFEAPQFGEEYDGLKMRQLVDELYRAHAELTRTVDTGDEINDLTVQVTWDDVPLANIPNLPASQTTSGEFADGRISQSSVTQHEDALTIDLDNFDVDLSAIMELNIGMALDHPDVSVSSNGTVITFTLEKTGTGDIRFVFSDGIHTHDCTDPIASVALTAGADDESPQINYVYILQSTKALTVSTSDWPSAQHAPLATVFCQTAASIQTDGVYKMHAWTDDNWDDSIGHLAHINTWIRAQPATWVSGMLATTSVGVATFDIAVATGVVHQLHDHTYPAFNTATGSEIMIVNQSGTPYDRVGNMVSQITDASGGSMSGKYYNLVVWGVQSQDVGDCQMMVNLPTGSYNTAAAATLDAEAKTVYDIPTDFIGTGFLVARLVVRHQVGGNTYSISSNIDLRGKVPSTSAGGTVGGGVTALADLSDVSQVSPTQFHALARNAGNTAWESRLLVEADISDLQTYLTAGADEIITGYWKFKTASGIEIQNAGGGENAHFYYDGDFNTDISGTGDNWDIRPGNGGRMRIWGPNTGLQLRDGGLFTIWSPDDSKWVQISVADTTGQATISAASLLIPSLVRIADAGLTDWADFSHDGTDFNTAFTNTTDWNITGITAMAVSGNVTASNLNVSNWDTAYGWGDHASGGYAPLDSPDFTGTVTALATRVLTDINTATPPTTEAVTGKFEIWDLANNDSLAYFGYEALNELIIRNKMHGGAVNVYGENTAGTVKQIYGGDPDGASKLYYAGAEKLATTSGGISVGGALTTSGQLTVNAGGNFIDAGVITALELRADSSGPWALKLTRTDLPSTIEVFNAGEKWHFNPALHVAGPITGATTIAATGAVTGSNLNVSNWDTAYGWGDHASGGYAPLVSPAFTGNVLITAPADSTVNLNLKRFSATGRAQFTLKDQTGADLWRCGTTAAGGSDFGFYDGTADRLKVSSRGIEVIGTDDSPAALTSKLSSNMLHIDGKEAIDGNDTYLRLNQNGDFSNGVFINSRFEKSATGNFYVKSLNFFSGADTAPGASNSSLSANMLHINGKRVFTGTDTWLRINQGGDFTSGVNIEGNGLLRADGGFQVNGLTTRDTNGVPLKGGLGMFYWTTAGQTGGIMTISTSAASGGANGDIHFKY